MIRDAEGRIARLFMACGTRLATDRGRTVLLHAARPATVEVVYGEGTLALAGEALAGLRVRAPGVGTEGITVNGKATSAAEAGIVLLP